VNKSTVFLSAAFAALLFSVSAPAATITVDESGHGLPYHLGTDPGPGGLPNALIYTLPFTGTSGDVELIEPETGIPGDVLRFNGDGTLIFYSQGTAPNTPDLADQPRPPAPVANTVVINETAAGDAFYTPTAGQPGFDASALPIYHFISDTAAAIPEPSSVALFLVGGLGLVAGGVRRRKTS